MTLNSDNRSSRDCYSRLNPSLSIPTPIALKSSLVYILYLASYSLYCTYLYYIQVYLLRYKRVCARIPIANRSQKSIIRTMRFYLLQRAIRRFLISFDYLYVPVETILINNIPAALLATDNLSSSSSPPCRRFPSNQKSYGDNDIGVISGVGTRYVSYIQLHFIQTLNSCNRPVRVTYILIQVYMYTVELTVGPALR